MAYTTRRPIIFVVSVVVIIANIVNIATSTTEKESHMKLLGMAMFVLAVVATLKKNKK